MQCPGSVSLLKELSIREVTDEPEWRAHGTAAHAVANLALTADKDAWEYQGQTIEGVEIPAEFVPPIQVYLDRCREGEPDLCGVEQRIQHADHPLYYGTVDRWEYYTGAPPRLVVRDFKFGEGVVVDVEDNPQIMYYTFGLLGLPDLTDVVDVELEIVQPRAFHHDGPIRTWHTTKKSIHDWAHDTLFPAMARTALDHTLHAGPWCRFCPAKLVCPLMVGIWGAAMKAIVNQVIHMDNATLGRDYNAWQAVKMYGRAIEEQAFDRRMRGEEVPYTKLVHKKAIRVFKPAADTVLVARLGDQAMTKPQLKSPAEIEKLGAEAQQLVKQYAYTPTTGLTIAGINDMRQSVKVEQASEVFGADAGEKS